MIKLWKDFRTNMMYWRFRHITRNRLRLRSWWQRHRPARRQRPSIRSYSPPPYRGLAARVYPSTQRRSLMALGAMVVLLTALSVLGGQHAINGAIYAALQLLIIIGAVYWALRGI
jgi:hypothetical protein